MKTRSELREIIMHILYQVNILNDAKLEYNIEDLIKEQIEVENNLLRKVLTVL